MATRRRLPIVAAAFVFLVSLFFLFPTNVHAAPAAPVEIILTQPDGTSFVSRQWGDEWNNGMETVEGYTILQQADGWWVYAQVDGFGTLSPSAGQSGVLRVGIESPKGLARHLRPSLLNQNPHSSTAMNMVMPSIESPQAPAVTTLKTLVLLADFSNTTPAYTAGSFQTLMFSTSSNSVRDFYRDNSFNNLDIIPAEETCGTSNDGITDWTELGYSHPNTGSSITTANLDIVKNVLVANDGCINFANFDTNGNGYIETNELSIVVVVAGYERAYSTDSPSVWAHQGWLDSATGGAPQLDGKWLGVYGHGNYAQFGERHSSHQATIGIMAHEFGHIINWPDLYDIDKSSEGVGEWSIMGSGNWTGVTNDGDSPAMADAWSKWYQGWITPTVVSGTMADQAINQAETNATAFLLRPNPGGVDWLFNSHSGTGQYFLVENRNTTGYDSALPGCGLLIWHIDETVTYSNSANANENDPLVALEQADGNNELYYGSNRGDPGDPYPGSESNANFSSSTTPNSNLYSGSASDVSVHVDSSSCGASMQADLIYGSSTPPGTFSKVSPANTATNQSTSQTLDWEDSLGAISFDYCLDNGTPDGGCDSGWVTGLNASQVSLSLAPSTSYEWQVIAHNSYGSTEANSGTWWTFTTGTASGDVYEDDDTYLQAKSIVSGVTQTHSIDPAGDPDYVTFTLTANSAVTLETSGPGEGDTVMTLYDGTGTNDIDYNDDGGSSLYSLLQYACDGTPLAAGTYYVKVNDFGADDTIAEYQLSYTAAACVEYSEFSYLPAVLRPLSPPGAFAKLTPSNGTSGVSLTPTLDWEDASGATSYEYCYDALVNGTCTGAWTTTGVTSQVTLPTLPASTAHEWQVRANNTSGIPTYANGGTLWSFTTGSAGVPWTTITSENFEGTFPQSGWSRIDNSSYDGGEYLIGKRTCNVNSGSYSGWLVGGGTNGSALGCGANYVNYTNTWFVYGPFSTVGATAAQLNYNYYVDSEYQYDRFWVMASSDNINYYGLYRTGAFTWQTDSIDLSQSWCANGTSSCLGKSNVWIAFSFDSDSSITDYYGAIVDNIVLRKCTSASCTGAPALEGPLLPSAPGLQDLLEPFARWTSGLGMKLLPN